jgi:hypothetical protein
MFGTLGAVEVKIELSGVRSEQVNSKSPMMPTVTLGDPFMLKIVLSGSQHNPQINRSELPKKFRQSSYHNSTNIQVINGYMQSSTTHVFELEPLVEGEFIIGPFTVEGVQSNAIKIRVRERSEADGDIDNGDEEPRDEQRAEFHLRLASSGSEGFVGGPLLVSRVSLIRGQVQRSEAEPFSCPNAIIKKLPGDLSRIETINNKQYRATEERYLVFPNAPGTLTFPAQRFIYDYIDIEQRKRTHHPFGFLMDQLMAFQTQRAQGRTNTLTYQIKPLPHLDKAIDAVGQFESYTMRVDKNEVAANEPVTLIVSLSGIGNFDEIPAPHLKLPREMTVYPSGSTMVNEIDTHLKPGVKEFSYVVQSQRPGTITIPEQEFTFFDTQTGKVNTLTTDSIQLSVTPSTTAPLPVQPAEPKKTEKTEIALPTRVAPSQEQKIPWSIFFLLLILPFFVLWRSVIELCKRLRKRATKVNSSDLLGTEMAAYFAKGDKAAVGMAMRRWIAERTGTSAAFVTESFIEEELTKAGCVVSEIEQVKQVYFWTLGAQSRMPVTESMIVNVITILRKL